MVLVAALETSGHADGPTARAALGFTRMRVDVGRDEEPSSTGGAVELGVGYGWRGVFLEVDAAAERSAVVSADDDRPVDAITILGLGAALGLRSASGLEAAAIGRRAELALRYEDPDWDYDRGGWAFGARAVKTWPVRAATPRLALGVQLGAEVLLLDRDDEDRERPLVWTYRASAILRYE